MPIKLYSQEQNTGHTWPKSCKSADPPGCGLFQAKDEILSYVTRHGVRDAGDGNLLVLHSDPRLWVLHVLHEGFNLQHRTAKAGPEPLPRLREALSAARREQKMHRETAGTSSWCTDRSPPPSWVAVTQWSKGPAWPGLSRAARGRRSVSLGDVSPLLGTLREPFHSVRGRALLRVVMVAGSPFPTDSSSIAAHQPPPSPRPRYTGPTWLPPGCPAPASGPLLWPLPS